LESTDELFVDDALVSDPHGDEELAPVESQTKPVKDSTRQLDEVQVVERDEDAPVQQ